jgi:riboflavin biosynthesis pyrimidine reductase
VLVEGGKSLHESFLKTGAWDEIRRIISTDMNMPEGYPAPALSSLKLIKSENLINDRIDFFNQLTI